MMRLRKRKGVRTDRTEGTGDGRPRGTFKMGTTEPTSRGFWFSNPAMDAIKAGVLPGVRDVPLKDGPVRVVGTDAVGAALRLLAHAGRPTVVVGQFSWVATSNADPRTGYVSKERHDVLYPPSGRPDASRLAKEIMPPRTGGDGYIWEARAAAFVEGLGRVLEWVHDTRGTSFDLDAVHAASGFESVFGLAEGVDGPYPDMPDGVRDGLKWYIESLPGYDRGKGLRQNRTTLDQHGYLAMQLGATARAWSALRSPDSPVVIAPVEGIVDVAMDRGAGSDRPVRVDERDVGSVVEATNRRGARPVVVVDEGIDRARDRGTFDHASLDADVVFATQVAIDFAAMPTVFDVGDDA